MRILVASLLGVLACACSNSVSSPSNAHQNGAGTSFPPSQTMVYRVAANKPTKVMPGELVGYSLTVTAPATYRFEWTGDASANGTGAREFYGSVWTHGHVKNIIPGCAAQACPLEPGSDDFVSSIATNDGDGQRVDWDTIASTGFDGFDFTVDSEPVFVDLFVDGAHTPGIVYFPSADTGMIASPTALPFGLTSQ